MIEKLFSIISLSILFLGLIIYITILALRSWGVHDYSFGFILFLLAFILFVIYAVVLYKLR